MEPLKERVETVAVGDNQNHIIEIMTTQSTLTSILANSMNGTGGNGGSGSGIAAKSAATVGLSLAIIRLVAHAMKIVDQQQSTRTGQDDDDDSTNSTSFSSVISHRSEILYQFVRTMLKRLIFLENDNHHHHHWGKQQQHLELEDDDEDETERGSNIVPITHHGSCHCGCVVFEVCCYIATIKFWGVVEGDFSLTKCCLSCTS